MSTHTPRINIDLNASQVTTSGQAVNKVTWDPGKSKSHAVQTDIAPKPTVDQRLRRLEEHMQLVLQKLSSLE